MINKCNAEKVGLKVGNTIFLVAGTKELICNLCRIIECPYQLRDYSKGNYAKALRVGVETRSTDYAE